MPRLYRALKKTQQDCIYQKNFNDSIPLLDQVYSHVMISHCNNKDDILYSFTDKLDIALSFINKSRGKSEYDRIGYIDLDEQQHDFRYFSIYQLTDWLTLISQKNSSFITNLNYNTPKNIPTINAIIPSQKSAYSMSHGCREYIIIPDVDIPLTIINDVDNYTVPYDSIETKSNFLEIENFEQVQKTIIDLKNQLQSLKIQKARKSFLTSSFTKFESSLINIIS